MEAGARNLPSCRLVSLLKAATEGHRVRAMMTIAVEGNRATDIMTKLRGHPSMYTLHSTYDLRIDASQEM
jgi:hypothetical protein